MSGDFRKGARRLRNAVEQVAAGVYFAPEAHEAYTALGFEGSPVAQDGVARPELKSYFTSRGACMGQVPGEQGATAMLQRILGDKPDRLGRVTDLLRRAADAAAWEGRAIYGGLRSPVKPNSSSRAR
jgi:hypothetical protein